MKILFHSIVMFLFAVSRSCAQDTLFSSFNPAALRRTVSVLAADSLEGRLAGQPGNAVAAKYIAQRFNQAGLRPLAGNDGFFTAPTAVGGVNVIGAIPGYSRPGKVLIFSAHLDHIGTRATNPFEGSSLQRKSRGASKHDKIYNGANDDASGIAAMLALAEFYAAKKANGCTLLFIAFNGEESGLVGSGELARKFIPDSVIAVINLEMLGRARKSGSDQPIVTGADFSGLRAILNKQLLQSGKWKEDFFLDDSRFHSDLFYRSDNFSFAQRDIPAHTIMITTDEDPYYHSLSDEVDTLDYFIISHVCQALSEGCTTLVTGEQQLEISLPSSYRQIGF